MTILSHNFNDATTDQNIFGMPLSELSAESIILPINTQIYFGVLHLKLQLILSSRMDYFVHSYLVPNYSTSKNEI